MGKKTIEKNAITEGVIWKTMELFMEYITQAAKQI